MTLYYFVSPDGDYIETEDNVKDFYEKKFNPDMFTVRAKAEAEAVRRMKLRIKELKCLIKELMIEQLRLASYIKPISEADLHLVADGIERLQTQLTETRDLAEHWAILAEQRRVELGECRKLQDLSYMDGLVMRMTYRNGDKVFNVQRGNTLAQLERVSLGAKFIVGVNANDMWQDLLDAMEAKP